MRCLVVGLVLACRSREASPVADPPPGPLPGSSPGSSQQPVEVGAAPSTWIGDPIGPRVVHSEATHFALGNDLTFAVATTTGWLGTRFRSSDAEDLVDDKGVITTGPSARLVVDRDVVYAVFEGVNQPSRVSRLVKRKLVPLTGEVGFHWAFGNVGIENDTRSGLRTQHWQTVAIGRDRIHVVDTSDGPYATGATRLGDEVIVATREHDPPASTQAKAEALVAAEQGNTARFAKLVGQPRGWLLHVDTTGHVTSKELFSEQPPSQIVATKSGWLVIATEGTAGHMFNDGVLLARAPNDATLHVLARNIELGSQLIASGDWACMFTMPGESRVVHCVDPIRRIHITSEPLADNIALYGIELVPKPRLLLHHTWYRDGYGKPSVEETLALALP